MLESAKHSRSLSVTNLVLFGFVLSILPLLIAIISAIHSISELAKDSRVTVYRAVRTDQESRILLEKVRTMERSAKQSVVLDDPVFLQSYENEHKEFVALIQALILLTSEKYLLKRMQALAAEEIEVYRYMTTDKRNPDERPQASEKFKNLDSLSRDLMQNSIGFVATELNRIDQKTELVQKRILLESSILLPVSFILVCLFVYLIVRPIRQLDKAIRRLGSGDLDRNIAVSGPADLRYLGERLNWLRTRLKEVEREKRRVFRNLSHELKTPLATIHEGAEILVDEVVGELNPEQEDITKILIASSERLEKLINDLLQYSQMRSKMNDLAREQLDLKEVVRSVIDDSKVNMMANHIKLSLDVARVYLYANRDNMCAVIDNLLSNAIKFSPKGGEIRISVHRQGDNAIFEIEDNGIGIPIDERTRIFDVFYQGRVKSQGGIQGSGVGLAIVKDCIIEHHGKIEALNPRLGKTGAFFQVTIPIDIRESIAA